MEYFLIGLVIINTATILFVIWHNFQQKAAIDRHATVQTQQINELNDLFLTKFDNKLESKLSEWNRTLSDSLQEVLKEFRMTTREAAKQTSDTLTRLSTTYEQHIEAELSALSNDFSHQLEKKLAGLHTAIQERMEHYLIQEDEEARQWLLSVQAEKNDRLAIQQLESAMNKFPSNGVMAQEYSKRIEKFLLSSNVETQKIAIERYNRVARAYLDNCNPEEWNVAKELYDETLKLGNLHMKSQVKRFKKQAEKTIEELEKLVDRPTLTDSRIQRVEELDQQLSKELLRNHKELHQRYQQVTNRLLKQISPDNKEEDIRAYNLEAVNKIKRAQTLFISRENSFKQGSNLHQLADLLGAWDQTYLTPATQLYLQTVYSDIFGKLNVEYKPEMTEIMLRVPKKKVSA